MPTARPIIEIRFGVKKLKSHSTPNRPTTPRVTAIAKIPIAIGVSPGHDGAEHDDQDDDRGEHADALTEAQVFLGDALEVLEELTCPVVGLDAVP